MRCKLLDIRFVQALLAQFCLGFLTGLAEHQRLALRQAVGVQPLMMIGHRVEADHRDDEVRRNQLGALVQQLVIGMLAIAADTTPDHRAGVGLHRGAVLQHALAVGLHVQLLQVLGDVAQVVVVRQDRVASCAPEVAVPDARRASSTGMFLSNGAVWKCWSMV